MSVKLRQPIFAAVSIFIFAIVGQTQQPVIWTQHNGNTRAGNNNLETALTTTNVSPTSFGKLFSYTLDDQTYSQPLYIPNLTLTVADKKPHNVVFATTVNNTVYAWDADSNIKNGGQPLWKTNLSFGESVPNAQYYSSYGDDPTKRACGGKYHDFAGNVGMVGTPVIDTANGVLYVVAHTYIPGSNPNHTLDVHHQRLYALDITSGAVKLKTDISGSYQGSSFDPLHNNQRPALALVGGVIYVGWSSYCDWTPYHGWVMGYRTSDLKQAMAWSTSPSGSQGGLWQAGQGIMADVADNLYFMTGNGTLNETNDYAMSAVRLSPWPAGFPSVTSFFTPGNYLCLNGQDMDFGSAGPILLPGTDIVAGEGLVVGGGKEGVLYLMQANNLGGYKPNGGCTFGGDNVIQEFQAVFPDPGTATMHIHGGPVFYDSGTHQYVYIWGENDSLRAYEFLPGTSPHFNSTAVAASAIRAPQAVFSSNGGMPGGFLSVSSNGTSNGIVWALAVYACNANQNVEPGILYAFDASTFSATQLKELWDSRVNGNRDDVGYFAKFTYPTVANGKVYAGGWGPVSPLQPPTQCATNNVPSNQGEVSVYGLLGSADLSGAFNREGIVSDGTSFSGGLDGGGFAYSANLLGTSLAFNGSTFLFGVANSSNAISAAGQTIALRPGQYSSLGILATGVNGNQLSQTFKVNYSDGTSSSFTQSLSDWFAPQNYPDESKAKTMAYRNSGNGTQSDSTFYLYAYNFSLNSSKTAQSVTLPNNNNVVVLSISVR